MRAAVLIPLVPASSRLSAVTPAANTQTRTPLWSIAKTDHPGHRQNLHQVEPALTHRALVTVSGTDGVPRQVPDGDHERQVDGQLKTNSLANLDMDGSVGALLGVIPNAQVRRSMPNANWRPCPCLIARWIQVIANGSR